APVRHPLVAGFEDLHLALALGGVGPTVSAHHTAPGDRREQSRHLGGELADQGAAAVGPEVADPFGAQATGPDGAAQFAFAATGRTEAERVKPDPDGAAAIDAERESCRAGKLLELATTAWQCHQDRVATLHAGAALVAEAEADTGIAFVGACVARWPGQRGGFAPAGAGGQQRCKQDGGDVSHCHRVTLTPADATRKRKDKRAAAGMAAALVTHWPDGSGQLGEGRL